MHHIPGDEVGKSIGMVNFFNNKRGYGFITTLGMDIPNKDVFIHQTNINPLVSGYRTLSQGEYVSFDISESNDKRYAINVKGING